MIVRRYDVLISVGILVGMLGCASLKSEDRPSWVMGSSPEFPTSRYLVGIGQAQSRESAEERAYAAIAKIFKAKVQSQTQDTEAYRLLEREGQEMSERTLAIERFTRVTTNKVLENVKILDRWIDPQSRTFYVLAGIDRQQAEQALREKITEYDDTIDDDVRQARQSTDKLQHIGKLQHAIQSWHLRERLNADLRIIRENGAGIPSSFRLNELTHELDQFFAQQFLLKVEVLGEQSHQVRAAIIERLRREGLPVSNHESASSTLSAQQSDGNGLAPDLFIQGHVHLWDIDVPDPLFAYVRWCGDFTMLDPANQRVVGVVSRSGREGHITQSEARARASSVMQAVLADEVVKALGEAMIGSAQPSSPASSGACPQNLP